MFSFIHQLTTWHSSRLVLHAVLWPHAAAAPAMQQLIYPLGLQQQTCCTLLELANGTDRWADGRKPVSCIDPALHAMRAVPTIHEQETSKASDQLTTNDLLNLHLQSADHETVHRSLLATHVSKPDVLLSTRADKATFNHKKTIPLMI